MKMNKRILATLVTASLAAGAASTWAEPADTTTATQTPGVQQPATTAPAAASPVTSVVQPAVVPATSAPAAVPPAAPQNVQAAQPPAAPAAPAPAMASPAPMQKMQAGQQDGFGKPMKGQDDNRSGRRMDDGQRDGCNKGNKGGMMQPSFMGGIPHGYGMQQMQPGNFMDGQHHGGMKHHGFQDGQQQKDLKLDASKVKTLMDAHLIRQGADSELHVGEITSGENNTFNVNILDVDNKVVKTLQISGATGRPVKSDKDAGNKAADPTAEMGQQPVPAPTAAPVSGGSQI